MRQALGAYLWYALGILLALLIWQVSAAGLGPYRLPGLAAIAAQFLPLLTVSQTLAFQGGGSDGFLPHLLHTIVYALAGSAIGSAAGIAFGLLMARLRIVRNITEIPLELLRTIPPLAAIPFVLIWIGPGNEAQLLLVSYYAFVMLVVTALNAASNIDPVLTTLAATLGGSENRIFRTVVLPAMLPTLVGGIRVAVGISWSVQVVAELMGGRYGMGRVFAAMISFRALDAIVVGILWLSLSAAIVDALMVLVIRRFTRWA